MTYFACETSALMTVSPAGVPEIDPKYLLWQQSKIKMQQLTMELTMKHRFVSINSYQQCMNVYVCIDDPCFKSVLFHLKCYLNLPTTYS